MTRKVKNPHLQLAAITGRHAAHFGAPQSQTQSRPNPSQCRFELLDLFGYQIDKSTNRLTGIITASLIIGSSIVMSVDAGPKIFKFALFWLCRLCHCLFQQRVDAVVAACGASINNTQCNTSMAQAPPILERSLMAVIYNARIYFQLLIKEMTMSEQPLAHGHAGVKNCFAKPICYWLSLHPLRHRCCDWRQVYPMAVL